MFFVKLERYVRYSDEIRREGECLKDVDVDVPAAVSLGDTVALRCSFDLEGESLYTVKWYQGKKEFFRYVPKELPPTKVFPLPGVNVDVSDMTLVLLTVFDKRITA
ncbi:hypothetical protein J437_LFUL014984 [Ladona fulva]|uniref:Ig-like domain-containing protein n=1 Tax=Ladona fulva TaxID=123851 RepID=A0A8K0KHC3_LADFU|nr:hypothetical protein J437_LFUL014984 [Ladona fulva]